MFLGIYILTKAKYQFQTSIKNGSNTITNSYINKKMQNIILNIQNGMLISNAFKNSKLFDSLTIKLIVTAEYTNDYENILYDITQNYKTNFNKSIEAFTSMIEPSLIIIISLIILWLVSAIMVPMWDINNFL
jgi:general secretion pathway protein F